MTGKPLRRITTTEVEAFDRDGAVLVKGVLPSEWIDRLRVGLDAAIAEPDVLSENLGPLRVDQFPASRVPELRSIVEQSPMFPPELNPVGNPLLGHEDGPVLVPWLGFSGAGNGIKNVLALARVSQESSDCLGFKLMSAHQGLHKFLAARVFAVQVLGAQVGGGGPQQKS